MSPDNRGSVRIAPGDGASVHMSPDNRAGVKSRPRSRTLGGASGGPVRAMRWNERRGGLPAQQPPHRMHLENVDFRRLPRGFRSSSGNSSRRRVS